MTRAEARRALRDATGISLTDAAKIIPEPERDTFASAAMAALIANPNALGMWTREECGSFEGAIARAAYGYADAMINARELP